MKTRKKLLSCIFAAAVLTVQVMPFTVLNAAAEETSDTHGDYYVVSPREDGTASGATLSKQNGMTLGYDAEKDALKIELTAYTKQKALIHSLNSTLQRDKYKYAAMGIMYDGETWEGNNNLGWALHTNNLSKIRIRERATADGPNTAWEKPIINLDEFIPESSFSSINWWVSWGSGTTPDGTQYTMQNYVMLTAYEKYMAFFETEEDAKAFDLSIKTYSINGFEGEIDNIAHTVTYNMEGVDKSVFDNAEPVITSDPLATVTKTSGDINYSDDIVYSVTNVFGETMDYTVSFDYGQDEEIENACIYSFDSAMKVSSIPLKFYNWQYASGEVNGPEASYSYDENTKSLLVNELRYGGAMGMVIDEEIDGINEYKYMKIKYRYAAPTSNSVGSFSNSVSLKANSASGVTLRDNIGFGYLFNGMVTNSWFTDIADISELTAAGGSSSRIRFTAAKNSQYQQIQVSFNVKYIALFKSYEDAVNYDNEAGFDSISISAANKKVYSSVEYTDDRSEPMLATAIYNNGKLCAVVMDDNPEFDVESSGVILNSAPLADGEINAESFIPERTATLMTIVNTADYTDGEYTAKTFMINKDYLRPYCAGTQISFKISNGSMSVIK